MTCKDTSRNTVGKKILAIALSGSLTFVLSADGATKSWTNNNGAGDNVWTTGSNWDPINQPLITDHARILSPAGSLNTGTILLRPSNSAGDVDCGSISIETGDYYYLNAGAATANFNAGTHSIVRFNVAGEGHPLTFYFGDGTGSTPRVTYTARQSLQIDTFAPKGFVFNPKVVETGGTATVSFTRVTGATDTSIVLIGENNSSGSSPIAVGSNIRDADFASETAALTRAQILVQANTSVLAQANSAPQNVLSLLQG